MSQAFICSIIYNAADGGIPEARDECGVRDPSTGRERECPDGRICVLDGLLNQCIMSKFLSAHFTCTHDTLVYCITFDCVFGVSF